MDSGSNSLLTPSQPSDPSDSAEKSGNGLALVLTVLVLFGAILATIYLI